MSQQRSAEPIPAAENREFYVRAHKLTEALAHPEPYRAIRDGACALWGKWCRDISATGAVVVRLLIALLRTSGVPDGEATALAREVMWSACINRVTIRCRDAGCLDALKYNVYDWVQFCIHFRAAATAATPRSPRGEIALDIQRVRDACKSTTAAFLFAGCRGGYGPRQYHANSDRPLMAHYSALGPVLVMSVHVPGHQQHRSQFVGLRCRGEQSVLTVTRTQHAAHPRFELAPMDSSLHTHVGDTAFFYVVPERGAPITMHRPTLAEVGRQLAGLWSPRSTQPRVGSSMQAMRMDVDASYVASPRIPNPPTAEAAAAAAALSTEECAMEVPGDPPRPLRMECMRCGKRVIRDFAYVHLCGHVYHPECIDEMEEEAKAAAEGKGEVPKGWMPCSVCFQPITFAQARRQALDDRVAEFAYQDTRERKAELKATAGAYAGTCMWCQETVDLRLVAYMECGHPIHDKCLRKWREAHGGAGASEKARYPCRVCKKRVRRVSEYCYVCGKNLTKEGIVGDTLGLGDPELDRAGCHEKCAAWWLKTVQYNVTAKRTERAVTRHLHFVENVAYLRQGMSAGILELPSDSQYHRVVHPPADWSAARRKDEDRRARNASAYVTAYLLNRMAHITPVTTCAICDKPLELVPSAEVYVHDCRSPMHTACVRKLLEARLKEKGDEEEGDEEEDETKVEVECPVCKEDVIEFTKEPDGTLSGPIPAEVDPDDENAVEDPVTHHMTLKPKILCVFCGNPDDPDSSFGARTPERMRALECGHHMHYECVGLLDKIRGDCLGSIYECPMCHAITRLVPVPSDFVDLGWVDPGEDYWVDGDIRFRSVSLMTKALMVAGDVEDSDEADDDDDADGTTAASAGAATSAAAAPPHGHIDAHERKVRAEAAAMTKHDCQALPGPAPHKLKTHCVLCGRPVIRDFAYVHTCGHVYHPECLDIEEAKRKKSEGPAKSDVEVSRATWMPCSVCFRPLVFARAREEAWADKPDFHEQKFEDEGCRGDADGVVGCDVDPEDPDARRVHHGRLDTCMFCRGSVDLDRAVYVSCGHALHEIECSGEWRDSNRDDMDEDEHECFVCRKLVHFVPEYCRVCGANLDDEHGPDAFDHEECVKWWERTLEYRAAIRRTRFLESVAYLRERAAAGILGHAGVARISKPPSGWSAARIQDEQRRAHGALAYVNAYLFAHLKSTTRVTVCRICEEELNLASPETYIHTCGCPYHVECALGYTERTPGAKCLRCGQKIETRRGEAGVSLVMQADLCADTDVDDEIGPDGVADCKPPRAKLACTICGDSGEEDEDEDEDEKTGRAEYPEYMRVLTCGHHVHYDCVAMLHTVGGDRLGTIYECPECRHAARLVPVPSEFEDITESGDSSGDALFTSTTDVSMPAEAVVKKRVPLGVCGFCDTPVDPAGAFHHTCGTAYHIACIRRAVTMEAETELQCPACLKTIELGSVPASDVDPDLAAAAAAAAAHERESRDSSSSSITSGDDEDDEEPSVPVAMPSPIHAHADVSMLDAVAPAPEEKEEKKKKKHHHKHHHHKHKHGKKKKGSSKRQRSSSPDEPSDDEEEEDGELDIGGLTSSRLEAAVDKCTLYPCERAPVEGFRIADRPFLDCIPAAEEPIPRSLYAIDGISRRIVKILQGAIGLYTHSVIRARRHIGAARFDAWYAELVRDTAYVADAKRPGGVHRKTTDAKRAHTVTESQVRTLVAKFGAWCDRAEAALAGATGVARGSVPDPTMLSGWFCDVPGFDASLTIGNIMDDTGIASLRDIPRWIAEGCKVVTSRRANKYNTTTIRDFVATFPSASAPVAVGVRGRGIASAASATPAAAAAAAAAPATAIDAMPKIVVVGQAEYDGLFDSGVAPPGSKFVISHGIVYTTEDVKTAADAYRASLHAQVPQAPPPADVAHRCAACGKPATMMCAACKRVHYCSQACQARDWPSHRETCTM